MIQVTVAGMILDQQTQGPILLLHIPPLNRYLPVWIGPSEAASIGMALRGERFERPLTHDLLVTVIDGLDGRVQKVTITELRGNTFIARIYIERGQQVIGIDARPSDSIAVAIRTGSPVFLSEQVVEHEREHLLRLDDEGARRLFGRGGGKKPSWPDDLDLGEDPGDRPEGRGGGGRRDTEDREEPPDEDGPAEEEP